MTFHTSRPRPRRSFPVVVNPCPFTFAHTRHWCGYDQCRDA